MSLNETSLISSEGTFVMPEIMGILNVTPDSFSDGGKFSHLDKALTQVESMIRNGASYIDIGGESTRPGAAVVSVEDELARVVPVLKAIKVNFDVKVSIDTSKSEVMSACIEHNADLINDVRALQNEGCLDVLAQCNLPICLMHMQGKPQTMQAAPRYHNVVSEVYEFFQSRISACEQAGIKRERLILDPGFGFGKTVEQNFELLAKLESFHALSLPVLVGTSRKSMIGNLLNRAVDERLAGSLATVVLAAQKGAQIIRVHDVAETMDVLNVLKINSMY